MKKKILVVDDDEILRITVSTALEGKGYQTREACNGQEAIDIFEKEGPFSIVLIDVNMPKVDGLTALARIKEISPKTICLVLTAFSKVKDAVSAIKSGAYDYLEKPVDVALIVKTIESAVKASSMVEIAAFSSPILEGDTLAFKEGRSMIGDSDSLKRVFNLIYKLSKVDTSVLIRGESGTGKELVAQALHYNSHRRKGPFVSVNCGAIPDSLIESELFGHEKGSFTGADRKKIGKFQYAAGGTIFLDEIGDISSHMQVKLLRVLQEKKFMPLGSNKEVDADVRVISATNKPLEDMIEKEVFRSDLFYRLNVLPIHLPPLRDRTDDIEKLVAFLMNKFNVIHNKTIEQIDSEALALLKNYSWPGNIRELENAIEHSFILEASNIILKDSLPGYIIRYKKIESTDTNEKIVGTPNASTEKPKPVNMANENNVSGSSGSNPQKMVVDETGDETVFPKEMSDLKYPALKEKFEKWFLEKALKAHKGKINQTAEGTQMTKVTLLRKLEKYGINPKEYRS